MAFFRTMGVDSVAYHRRTVLGREDDYSGQALAYHGSGGETPLRWGGALAARLGLSGAVDEAGYEAIFGPGGARDPDLGTRLVATRRPGVELVVAAHKSVAMLGLIGRADDMHAILDAETDGTCGFFDDWFLHQGGRRGREQRRTPTSGLLWARTRHLVSRDGDPGPHDHVMVSNVVEMLDGPGGFKALDTAALRDLLHAATMVGRLAAAAKAVELGYAIKPDHGPSGKLDHWAIVGIPEVVTARFSKRSVRIDAAMEESGFSSYRARGIAARNTRAPKRAEPMESLIPRWLDELEAIGWSTRKINQRLRLAQERSAQRQRHLSEEDRRRVVYDLIGPAGPLAERKAFTRADVIRLAAPRLYGCVPEELDRVVSATLAHPDAIPLVGQPAARGRAWAAASALAVEQAIEAVAERLTARQAKPTLTLLEVRQAIAGREAALARPLTTGQRLAVEAITTSGRGLDVVVGVAGSGKTTALEVAREAFEAGGYRLLGTAISGQAARTLAEEAGVEARTVASLVARLERGSLSLDDRSVLLVDEASMTDDPALLKLLAAVEVAGAKAVVIGDHFQLGPVGPGGGLEALVARNGPAVHVLAENVRQRHRGERKALAKLRAGDVGVAVDWYRRHRRVLTAPSHDQALEAAVEAWHGDVGTGHRAVLLAWRRRDVRALNQLARQRCLDNGAVSGPDLECPGGRRYGRGDRVITLAPAADGRFVTSERATVVDVGGDRLTVRFDDGRHSVLSGEELDSDHLDHAYAVTVHRMQGATVDRAHVFADGGGRELAYVAMSRARDTSHVYVVADDLDQAGEDLIREWALGRRQRWVLDTDAPAGAGVRRRPGLVPSVSAAIRRARLRAERDAVCAVAPQAKNRLNALDIQLRTEGLMLDDARRRLAPDIGIPGNDILIWPHLGPL